MIGSDRTQSADFKFDRIPVRHALDLPSAGRQTRGFADLTFDTKALVWVQPTRRRPVVPLERPPAPVTPEKGEGRSWAVSCGLTGVRLWTFARPDRNAALAEVERLCAGQGWCSGDAVLSAG